jgi:hypothetical protein
MTRVFAKQFFRLNRRDQTAVVEAVPRDIEGNYGRYVSPDDERRARWRAARIRTKAVDCGILRG